MLGESLVERHGGRKIGLFFTLMSLVGSTCGLWAQSSSVTLAWNPSSGSAGYRVYWGGASKTYTNMLDAGNKTNATISGLKAGVTFYCAVTAYNSVGLESPYSSEITWTPSGSMTNTDPPPTLSPPWQSVDIGNVGAVGSAYNMGGLYTVNGAGTLGGSSDRFQFVYQPLSGDGEIRAQINSIQNAGSGSCVGVMIRETLAAGSGYAFMGLYSTNTFQWQRRNNTGGNTSSTSSGTGVPPQTWARLVRSGNSLTGYKSSDGTNWTSVNSRNISMAANGYIGLAVASGSTNSLSTASFTNLTVVP